MFGERKRRLMELFRYILVEADGVILIIYDALFLLLFPSMFICYWGQLTFSLDCLLVSLRCSSCLLIYILYLARKLGVHCI